MDQHTDLLPRRLIFGNPERSIVRISHDGTRIAFLAPVDGVLNLWVGPIERVEDARPLTKVTDRNLGPSIMWMHDNQHVLFFSVLCSSEHHKIIDAAPWISYQRWYESSHHCQGGRIPSLKPARIAFASLATAAFISR